MSEKLTIADLEAMLNSDDEGNIELQPDGSIKVVSGDPQHAKPKIYTMREALGDNY